MIDIENATRTAPFTTTVVGNGGECAFIVVQSWGQQGRLMLGIVYAEVDGPVHSECTPTWVTEKAARSLIERRLKAWQYKGLKPSPTLDVPRLANQHASAMLVITQDWEKIGKKHD